MAASNRQKGAPLNVILSQTAPATATAVTIAGIVSGKIDRGMSHKTNEADGDNYPTDVFNDFNDPSIAFETVRAFVFIGIDPANLYTVTYKVADSRGGIGAAGGGYSITMTNSYLAGHNIDAQYREYGKSSTTFKSISTDGTTNPLTIAAL